LSSTGEEHEESGENRESRCENESVPERQEPKENAGKEEAFIEDDELPG
jgi:hypothetical protein